MISSGYDFLDVFFFSISIPIFIYLLFIGNLMGWVWWNRSFVCESIVKEKEFVKISINHIGKLIQFFTLNLLIVF